MIVPVYDIAGLGIIRDVKPYELPPEAWSDGVNIRFDNMEVLKTLGESSAFGTVPISPYWCTFWEKSAAERVWLYAGATKVYYVTGAGSHTNITRYTTTPGDNDYAAGAYPNWTGGVLNGVAILNNDGGADYPQQWDSGLNRLKDLANWPANVYAKFVVPYKNFIVAGNLVKSGVSYPHSVLWSHPADPGTVPTSYDTSDQTKDAGEVPLSDTHQLLDAYVMQDSLWILSENNIWQMQWTRGPFIHRFTRAVTGTGIITTGAGTVIRDNLIFVSKDDIMRFTGKELMSIADGTVRDWFFANVDLDNLHKIRVHANSSQDEVWVCGPYKNGGGYLDFALIWNMRTGAWSLRDLSDVTNFAYGNVALVASSETFDGSSGVSFDNDTGNFGGGNAELKSNYAIALVAAGASSKILQLYSTRQFDGSNFNSYLERIGLAIAGKTRQGTPKVDPSLTKFVRAVYPKVKGDSGVKLRVSVGSQYTTKDPIDWEGPYEFDPDTMEKVDFRVSGKYIAIRFEDHPDTASKQWMLSSYALDLDVVGMF